MNEPGIFCEVYGDTINNRIIEYFLIMGRLDFAAGDMAKDLEISRPRVYEAVKEFERKGYIIKSRVIGRTQLYKLNKENRIVKLLMKSFMECLEIVVDEYAEDGKSEEHLKERKAVAGKS